MIPIQNIYYILCYAWDKLKERDIVHIAHDDNERAEDMLAKVLCSGLTHLMKRGLDRGYISYHEETGIIRGKILFTDTLKKNFFKVPRLNCKYHEISHNVIHNQIIKSTLKYLLNCNALCKDNRDHLHNLYRKLHGIETIVITKRVFHFVQLHRNNYFYDFLLRICELIYDTLSPNEGDGTYRLWDFDQDEVMSQLFESFVRNFYKKELQEAKVGSEKISWAGTSNDEFSKKVLPEMRTDISLEFQSRKIIIDTKFYKEALKGQYDQKKLISGNLYQIFSYLMNAEEKEGYKNCEGILLYPVVCSKHDYEYVIKGHRIAIKTIDLNQPWQGIHEDLIRICK